MRMNTIVCKFGGTSLADASQIMKAADIIRADSARKFIVVSAPGKRYPVDVKVTDMLYKCYELAAAKKDFRPVLQDVRDRFEGIVRDLNIRFDLDHEIGLIRSVLQAAPQKDYAASRGEYLNAKILAAYLQFPFVDPADCVRFTDDGSFDETGTEEALSKTLSVLPHAVIAGFYGARPNGAIQTFSRGGSDVTGAIVAAAVRADLYENWTDVSGMLAADPRIVKDPRVIDVISYRELRILSYMGASVLHTDAVLPVRRAGIPINIRNTNSLKEPGTMIVPDADVRAHAVTGVAGRKGLSVVQVEKAMVSDGAGFTAILLDIFRTHRIPFEQCLTGIDTVSVVIRSDVLRPLKNAVLNEIRDILLPDKVDVSEDLSMIAVVGENTHDAHGITTKILNAVEEAGIVINTINQGAGDLNLIIGVSEEDYEKAMRVIYGVIS